MKRRELFGSLASSFKGESKSVLIRPPYINENTSFSKCKECEGLCANACETNIIEIATDKTPHLNFAYKGCTYCDECANICPHEVLLLENKTHISAKVEIDIIKCLSWNQTMCFSCKDPCLDDAIDFLAMFRPEINDNCTSCGFCIGVCPSDAIKIGA